MRVHSSWGSIGTYLQERKLYFRCLEDFISFQYVPVKQTALNRQTIVAHTLKKTYASAKGNNKQADEQIHVPTEMRK